MPVDTCALIPTYAKKFGGGVSEGASKTGKPGNEVGNIIYWLMKFLGMQQFTWALVF